MNASLCPVLDYFLVFLTIITIMSMLLCYSFLKIVNIEVSDLISLFPVIDIPITAAEGCGFA